MHGFWELWAEISVVPANSNLEMRMSWFSDSAADLVSSSSSQTHCFVAHLSICPGAKCPPSHIALPSSTVHVLVHQEFLKGRAWCGVWRPVGEPGECVCHESRQGETEGLSHSSAEEGTFQKEESEDLKKKNQPKWSSSGENGYVV